MEKGTKGEKIKFVVDFILLGFISLVDIGSKSFLIPIHLVNPMDKVLICVLTNEARARSWDEILRDLDGLLDKRKNFSQFFTANFVM